MHDLDRFLQGLEGLTWRAPGATIGDDALPEGARAKSQYYATPCDNVQGCRSLCQNGRRSQWSIGDVRKEPDVAGGRAEGRQQSPGIQESSVVWMVLDTDQIDAGLIGKAGHIESELNPARIWIDIDAK